MEISRLDEIINTIKELKTSFSKDSFFNDVSQNKNYKSHLTDFLHSKLTDEQLKYLKDNNISLRCVRLIDSKIKESLKLFPFKFMDVANEEWDNSKLLSYFEKTTFIFACFNDCNSKIEMIGVFAWKMPSYELFSPVYSDWLNIKKVIVEGVKFDCLKKEDGKYTILNNLPGAKDTKVVHVRPQAQRAAYKLHNGVEFGKLLVDANELPNGEWMTNQGYWINKLYLYNIVRDNFEEIIDFEIKELTSSELADDDELNNNQSNEENINPHWDNPLMLWKIKDESDVSKKTIKQLIASKYTLHDLTLLDENSGRTLLGQDYENCSFIAKNIDYKEFSIDSVPVYALLAVGVNENLCHKIKSSNIGLLELISNNRRDMAEKLSVSNTVLKNLIIKINTLFSDLNIDVSNRHSNDESICDEKKLIIHEKWSKPSSIWKLIDYGCNSTRVKKLHNKGLSIYTLLKMTETEAIENKVLECINKCITHDLSSFSFSDLSFYMLLDYDCDFKTCEVLSDEFAIDEMLTISRQELSSRCKFHLSKAEKIINSFNLLVCDYEIEGADFEICKKDVLSFVQNDNSGLNSMYIAASTGYRVDFVEKAVKSLFLSGLIDHTSLGIVPVFPSLIDCVYKISDNKKRDMVLMRLNGSTLEEIGRTFNFTRERARQLTTKQLKSLPKTKELSKYKDVFERYFISEETFVGTIGETKPVYNYLCIVLNRGKDAIDEEALLKEGLINEDTYETIISKKFIRINGERIVKSKKSLFNYFSKTIIEPLSSTEIIRNFNSFVKQYDLSGELEINTRYIETNYQSLHLINCYKLGFRYYEISKEIVETLIHEIDLKSYTNTVITTKKLFDENAELMDQLEIRDEYELHNILKQYLTKYSSKFEDVTFLRMPYIQFGDSGKNEITSNKIYEYAPISIELFLEMMEREYGFLKNTYYAYLIKEFSNYINDGMIQVEFGEVPEKDESIISELLTEDFYFLEDYKKMIVSNHLSELLLNRAHIKRLGFNLFSDYILKDNWKNASDYFTSMLFDNGVIDLNKYDKRYKNLTTFTRIIYDAETNLELFQFSKGRYITINKLNSSIGINKEFLKEKIQLFMDAVDDEEYFTLEYLSKKGIDNFVAQYGIEDTFFESLFRGVSEIKNISFMNEKLFKKSNKMFSKAQFVEDLINSLGPMSVYELITYLEDEYGLKIEFNQLVELIKKTNLYYNSVLEKIFIDYDQFMEELNYEFA